VALYSTTHAPVVECSLIGFVQPGSAAAAEGEDAEGSTNAAAAGETSDGSSSSGVQLHAAFAPVAGKAKAVLSVGVSRGGSWRMMRNIPMYF
jgi:hypothetical protein